MADRPLETTQPHDTHKRVVSPTLVTPGPQPVELLDDFAADGPQVLQGEVIGPRHARRRATDGRRRAAAGAILLSATSAATALFLLMGKDTPDAVAAPAHDATSAVPDGDSDEQADGPAAPRGESVAGEKPLSGKRAEESTHAPPVAQNPVATAASQTPQSGSPSSGQHHGGTGHRNSKAEDWQKRADDISRWARQQAKKKAEEQIEQHYQAGTHGSGQGSGTYQYGSGYGSNWHGGGRHH